MDVKELVAELRALIESARSMPMSSSAVVNRAEVLDLVSRLEDALPTAFAAMDQVVFEHDEVVAKGRDTSEQLIAVAEQERARLVSETDVFRVAKLEADQERAAARAEADELRKETDDYVDTRLATFEITLTKTLEAVSRGRARLQGRSHFDALSEGAEGSDTGADGRLTTPAELRSDDDG